jgi:hypothetical protein
VMHCFGVLFDGSSSRPWLCVFVGPCVAAHSCVSTGVAVWCVTNTWREWQLQLLHSVLYGFLQQTQPHSERVLLLAMAFVSCVKWR